MEYIHKLSSLQDYSFGRLYENIELVIYSAACFFVPFFIGHPQLAVGIIVNAMLVMSALNLRGYKLLPVIMIPCIGVLSRGLIFGPLTIFLVYFMPFIWIGNSILVFSFKYFRLEKNCNYAFTLLIGTILKSGFLFCSALVLFKLSIVPAPFLASMGALQLATAFIGGSVAYGMHAAKKVVVK